MTEEPQEPAVESDAEWEQDERRSRLEAERAAEAQAAAGDAAEGHDVPTLARIIEGLLFLSPDPVPLADLAEATGASDDDVQEAVALLDRQFAPGQRGLIVKRVGGGIALGTDPICEPAARALLSTQRIRRSPRRRPRRSPSWPTCSPSPAPRSHASAASPPTRPRRRS